MAKGKDKGADGTDPRFTHVGAGAPRDTQQGIKASLRAALTVEAEIAEWKAWLQHPNPAIRWEAFKLAQAYLYNKPIQPAVQPAQTEPITLRVEHIGASGDFFKQAAVALGLVK